PSSTSAPTGSSGPSCCASSGAATPPRSTTASRSGGAAPGSAPSASSSSSRASFPIPSSGPGETSSLRSASHHADRVHVHRHARPPRLAVAFHERAADGLAHGGAVALQQDLEAMLLLQARQRGPRGAEDPVTSRRPLAQAARDDVG